ncbi:MAG: hypothetical protein DMG65_16270 [Candidatus Angelobacter sp. Gp1-AA117]|nr:MAG: hypothetical protein DMG65_16270 [Candidatus Angelobacter sp. Gp1-AA117]
MAESWTKHLFEYGPFAMLVFYMSVTLRKASEFYRSARRDHNDAKFILRATWIGIFAITGFSLYVWFELNVSRTQEVMIQGRLSGLDSSGDLKSPFDDLYLRRVYKSKSRADFLWRIVRAKKLTPGERIEFYIQTTAEDDDVKVYELPFAEEFYQHEVALTYNRQTRKLFLETNGQPIPLAERDLLATNQHQHDDRTHFTFHLLPALHAQVNNDFEAMSERLKASDPIVRQLAWSDLAAMGSSGQGYIDHILADPTSAPRLRLGAIVALNLQGATWPLGTAATCTIVRATESGDTLLKKQAAKYVLAHPNLPNAAQCKEKSSSKTTTQETTAIQAKPRESKPIKTYINPTFVPSGDRTEKAEGTILPALPDAKRDPQLNVTLLLLRLKGKETAAPGVTMSLQSLLWEQGWVHAYTGHSEVNDADLSPDGRFLATAYQDSTVLLWDRTKGTQLRLVGHTKAVQSLQFSHDGATLATASDDTFVKLWDVATGTNRGTIKARQAVTRVMFSPTDAHVVTHEIDGRVVIWNTADGKQVFVVPDRQDSTQPEPISDFSYVPATGILVTGHENGHIHFWDPQAQHETDRWVHQFSERIRTILPNHDGTQFFITLGEHDAPRESWWLDSKTRKRLGPSSGDQRGVTTNYGIFTPQANLVLLGVSMSALEMWDADTQEDLLVLHGHRRWRSKTGITYAATHLVLWNKNTVRVLPLAPDAVAQVAEQHASPLSPTECKQYLATHTCPVINAGHP